MASRWKAKAGAIFLAAAIEAFGQDRPQPDDVDRLLAELETRPEAAQELARIGIGYLRAVVAEAEKLPEPARSRTLQAALRLRRPELLSREELHGITLDLNASGLPIQELAGQIARETSIPVEVVGDIRDMAVDAVLQGPLDEVLDRLARVADIAWNVEPGRRVRLLPKDLLHLQCRLYILDVSDLTYREANPASEDAVSIMEGEDLSELLRKSVDPPSWYEAGRAPPTFINGLLIFRNTPQTAAKVRKFVDDLRQSLAYQIRCRLSLLACPEGLVPRDPAGGGRLSSEDLGRIRDEIGRGAAWRIGDLELWGYNNQGMAGRFGEDRRLFSRHTADGTTGAQVFRDGISYRLRATVNEQLGRLQVHHEFTIDRILSVESRSSPSGPIDLPKVLTIRIEGDPSVPLGVDAVLAQAAMPEGFKGAKQLLVLGRFDLSRPPAPEPRESSGETESAKNLNRFLHRLETAFAGGRAEVRGRLNEAFEAIQQEAPIDLEILDRIFLLDWELSFRNAEDLSRSLAQVSRYARIPIRLELPPAWKWENDFVPGNCSLTELLNRLSCEGDLRWTLDPGRGITVRAGDNPARFGKFDVHDLAVPIESCKGPRDEQKYLMESIFSKEEIQELITQNIDWKIWERSDRFAVFTASDDQVFARAPETTLSKIDRMLRWLRELALRRTRAVVTVVASTPEAREKLRGDAKEWLRAADAGQGARRLGAWELVGRNGQWVAAKSGSNRKIVTGRDGSGRPVVEELFEGIRLSILTIAPHGQDAVRVQAWLERDELLAVGKAGTKEDVALPRLATNRLRADRVVPPGVPVILGVQGGVRSESSEFTELALIGAFYPVSPE